jgi:1-acyl-sn-glycerol-3-phosphate acyltransferase
VNTVPLAYAFGRMTIQPATTLATRLRVYGGDRVPAHGGVVLAFNHFSWLDPPVFGSSTWRSIYFMAKIEAHRIRGLGEFIRLFGTFSVRRGESDREAVRLMRQVVRDGHALGVFVEGTRQRNGVPGVVQPGAAMVALQEEVPVVPAAVYGTHGWRPGAPVSVAWGTPMGFDGLTRNGKGYREASAEIQREIRRLWEWLGELPEKPRPLVAVPPARP